MHEEAEQFSKIPEKLFAPMAPPPFETFKLHPWVLTLLGQLE